MGMSDTIADFIDQLLAEESTAELQRSELASRFGCVPSQINYVISTRFSPERGYVVESRRGGGGYIRIHRVQMEPKMLMMHTVNAIGTEIFQLRHIRLRQPGLQVALRQAGSNTFQMSDRFPFLSFASCYPDEA